MSAPAPPPRRDPGLQPERTRLAWRRTALALTIVTVLAVRPAFTGSPVAVALAVPTLALWAVAVTACRRRGARTGSVGVGGATLPLTALATTGYALLGVLLVIYGL
ncbi:protein of unknown function [Micromonospora nigra]|uniref:DUF202 domain-containing protein n=1 Tax=Micromonospora nigra TaxID=145857 RepID=A0A1C6SJA9_9ACTN|nr:DUF202 domain-containing protein [Micromonospora nigra]SCL29445.1 protein of unknown function [Micromonospora nigra]